MKSIYTYKWKAARHSKFGLDRVFTTPKMCNFPHFWTCRSFHNIQTIIFSIFGLAEVVITPELSIYPHYWTCQNFHNTQTIHVSQFLDLQEFSQHIHTYSKYVYIYIYIYNPLCNSVSNLGPTIL